ncbi:Hypothetical Protein FCC1311_035022 [Hondaea fermentalgiana]|uniref:CSC1/OSCA1-like cytosolic domain-containing protein n=1 Tax=Hondaea fermentalgiana TaxID=2315210 RepID=A0A2R5G8F3_9STRA|nr:Hypothetical Protein FCC1311_035022 [Hondaea fermentalgiana]|eukprot:GBG27280.1 Hypothetical Protein FCC1311_035022 [Hondaea fermentalgiana]
MSWRNWLWRSDAAGDEANEASGSASRERSDAASAAASSSVQPLSVQADSDSDQDDDRSEDGHDDHDVEMGSSSNDDDVSTVPAARGDAGGQRQVAVEFLDGPVGGLGRRVVERNEDVDTPEEIEASLRRKGANEVVELAAHGGKMQLNVDLRSEYTKPVVELALKYRQQHHPSDQDGNPLTFRDTPTGMFDLPCKKSKDPGLIRFGAGISSYFKLLKWMGIMYLTLFVLQIPIIVMNVNAGSHYDDAVMTITRTTLGNLYREPQGNLSEAEVVEIYEVNLPPACTDGRCTVSRDKLVFAYGIMDAVTTLVFLVFVALGKRFVLQERRKFSKEVLKVEHYTVQVEKIPEDCTAEVIQTHFENLVGGAIHDVQLVQGSGNSIALCVRRGRLMTKLARADARRKYLDDINAPLLKRDKAEDEFDAIFERVKQLDEEASRSAEAGAALFAFVTFEDQRDRARCLKMYRRVTFSLHQDPELKLNGEHELKVTAAPPPSTLLWENNEVSRTSRHVRAAGTTLMMAILLFLTIVISFASEPYKISKSLADVASGLSSYDTVCDGVFAVASSFEEAVAIADDPSEQDSFSMVNRPDLSLPDCLCEAVTSGITFPNGTTPEGLFVGDGYCAEYWSDRTYAIAVQVFVSFATLVMNTIIFFFLTGTAYMMKYTSVVRRELDIMRRLFITTYLNTGLVVLVVNADFQSVLDTTFNSFGQWLFQGNFDDFTQEWFRVVGVEIIMFAALNVLAPHIYPLVLQAINSLYRRYHMPISQSELNEMYLGPDFVLSYRYSQVLMMCFFLMTYSTGMPVLYMFGIISIPVTFAVDKFFFTHLCRTPAEFSGVLATWANEILQWAAVVHLVFGIWMLTSPYIFPQSSSDIALGALASITDTASDEELAVVSNITASGITVVDTSLINDIISRALQNQAIPNLLLLIFFFAWKILRNFRYGLVILEKARLYTRDAFARVFKNDSLSSLLDESFEDDRQLTFEQALDAGLISGIRSYYILANPKYARAFHRRDEDHDDTSEKSFLDILRQRATESDGVNALFSLTGNSFMSGRKSRTS